MPPAAVRNLEQVYRVEWTYNSNAIEGNTLTLLETKLVLEEGLTIGGKKLREHFEVINHSEAISFIEDMISSNTELTEYMIKSVHHLVLKNIDDENAGRYRMINVMISGSRHIPPNFAIVSEKNGAIDDVVSGAQRSASPCGAGSRVSFQIRIYPSFCRWERPYSPSFNEPGADATWLPSSDFKSCRYRQTDVL